MDRKRFLKKLGIGIGVAIVAPKALVGTSDYLDEQKVVTVNGSRQPTRESLKDLKNRVIEICIKTNNPLIPRFKNVEYIRYYGTDDGSCCVYGIYD